MESLVSSLAGEAVKDGLFELLNEEMSRISELWLQSKIKSYFRNEKYCQTGICFPFKLMNEIFIFWKYIWTQCCWCWKPNYIQLKILTLLGVWTRCVFSVLHLLFLSSVLMLLVSMLTSSASWAWSFSQGCCRASDAVNLLPGSSTSKLQYNWSH